MNEEQEGAAGPSDEAAADLARLQVTADEQPAAPGPGGNNGAAPGVPLDPVAEAADVIRFGVALLVPLYPSLAGVYTDAAQARLATVAGPLMQKYGVTLGGIFERWGPEINFVIVAGPLMAETARAVKADNAARRAPAEGAQKVVAGENQ